MYVHDQALKALLNAHGMHYVGITSQGARLYASDTQSLYSTLVAPGEYHVVITRRWSTVEDVRKANQTIPINHGWR